MTYADPCFGHELGQRVRRLFDGFDAVVHVVDLPAAPDLAQAGFANRCAIPLRDESLDRQTCGGGRGNQRQIAQSTHRHVQRARDRRRREREHMNVGAQLLQLLLVLDTEAVLLVDDQQAHLLETHTALQ